MQDSDEKIELLMRRHWITNIPWLLALFLGLLAPFFLAIFQVELHQVFGGERLGPSFQAIAVVVWYMLLLGFSLQSFLNWFYNVYIVTNKRIIDVDYWGLFFHRISDSYLDQVQDVSHDIQGMWEILFRFGDIYVQTASETLHIDFLSVPDPQFVHRRISELVAKAKASR